MKKFCLILVLSLLLCGCGAEQTMETIADDHLQSVMQEQREVILQLDEAAIALQGETGTLYLCDGYEVSVEVYAAGNLNATFQSITGFECDELTVLETAASGAARYECVWTAAGEEGDVVCRAAVLDDGINHYCLTATAAAEDAQALQQTWEMIFAGFALV